MDMEIKVNEYIDLGGLVAAGTALVGVLGWLFNLSGKAKANEERIAQLDQGVMERLAKMEDSLTAVSNDMLKAQSADHEYESQLSAIAGQLTELRRDIASYNNKVGEVLITQGQHDVKISNLEKAISLSM